MSSFSSFETPSLHRRSSIHVERVLCASSSSSLVFVLVGCTLSPQELSCVDERLRFSSVSLSLFSITFFFLFLFQFLFLFCFGWF